MYFNVVDTTVVIAVEMTWYLVFILMSLEPFVKAVLGLSDVLYATSCAGDTVYKIVTVAVGLYTCRVYPASCVGAYFAFGF